VKVRGFTVSAVRSADENPQLVYLYEHALGMRPGNERLDEDAVRLSITEYTNPKTLRMEKRVFVSYGVLNRNTIRGWTGSASNASMLADTWTEIRSLVRDLHKERSRENRVPEPLPNDEFLKIESVSFESVSIRGRRALLVLAFWPSWSNEDPIRFLDAKNATLAEFKVSFQSNGGLSNLLKRLHPKKYDQPLTFNGNFDWRAIAKDVALLDFGVSNSRKRKGVR
jgi:hypothetical protein